MNELFFLAPWLVWLLPLSSVPFAPLVARLGHKPVWIYSLAVSVASLVFASVGAYTYHAATSSSIAEWVSLLSVQIQIDVDGLSLLISLLVSFLVTLVLIYSLSYIKTGYARYYSLILLFAGSMLGLVMAGNLILFYFFWELVGICSALLIAFWYESDKARKAGMKAFIVTRIGDASLLLAIFVAYSLLGVTSFSGILSSFASLPKNYVSLFGILAFIGAMGKSAQVPLHGWLPDAMEGPTTVSALIHAATMVNAGVYLIIRLAPIYYSSTILSSMVLAIGLLSAFVGGLGALGSDDVKRVLAYSTISQLGLMFVAIGLNTASSATYHLISQGLFKALGFLSAGAVIESLGTRDMNEMGGLWRSMKITYSGFLLSVLAMSGLPPLVGFWSKESIISASGEGPLFYTLLVSSILTASYSFRALLKVFHGQAKSIVESKDPHPSMSLPIIILSVSVVIAWLPLEMQNLVAFSSLLPLPAYYTSILAIVIGFAPCLLAYQLYFARMKEIMMTNLTLQRLKRLLRGGLGFDSFYSNVATSFSSIAKAVARIQSGILQYNVALIFAALFILLLLGAVHLI
ncbi:MAG: NADH-quinone oxidoreductase subunit L [Conexivisphaerales archaeon]